MFDKIQYKRKLTGFKKNPKPKHFHCDGCEKATDHVTTSKTVCGIDIIPEGKRYCKRCVNRIENAYINKMIELYGED